MEKQRPWFTELSRTQWLILFIAWLGWIFDIADTALFNFAKVPMLKEMLGDAYPKVGTTIDGRLQAVFLVGWAVGGLIFGVVADKWGRTRTLVITILLYCVFTGLTALCHEPWQVAIARFLTALGIGGEWAAGAALVAEALPDRARVGAAAIIQSAAAVGPILAALANLAFKEKPWQWLFVIGIVPALLCVLIRASVKEPERTRSALQPQGSPMRALFADPTWRRNAIVAAVIGVVGIAGAGTATYWIPNLVNGVSSGLPKEVISARTSYVTMIAHIGTIAGVLLVPWLCHVIGRRTTIACFYVAAPAALWLGLSNPSYERLLIVTPVLFFVLIGVTASFVLYFPELFPTRIRATGAGLAYNVGRIFSIPVPIVTGALADRFGGPMHGGVAMAVVLTGAIYVFGLLALPFAPETRGKPLPE
jgi:MFS family permease